FTRQLNPTHTPNQATPLLISNQGRFVWSERPFDFEVKDDSLTITNNLAEVKSGEGYDNLRNVYQAVQERFFPAQGILPDPFMFTAPQYNTWIELMYDQEEEKILEYAQS